MGCHRSMVLTILLEVQHKRAHPAGEGWYSIYLPRRDGRISWPRCLITPGLEIEPMTARSEVWRPVAAPVRHRFMCLRQMCSFHGGCWHGDVCGTLYDAWPELKYASIEYAQSCQLFGKLYTVSHNYGNPWFLLCSFWINGHKVIKFSTCLIGPVNAVTFAKTHYWLNVCSKCPPLALMHLQRRVHHCLIAASIMRWSISSQAVRIRAHSSSMSLIRFL